MEKGQGVTELILALLLALLLACFIIFTIGEGKPVEILKKLWESLQDGGALSTALSGGLVFFPRWLAPEPERQLFGIGRRMRRKIVWIGCPVKIEEWEPQEYYGSLFAYLKNKIVSFLRSAGR